MNTFRQHLCYLLAFLPLALYGQENNGKEETISIRPVENFDVSGKGDALQWRTTEWIQLEKRKGTADYSTRVKLLYSSTGIYGLFSCEDTKITASLKEDFSNLWTEDVVEIFFWTDESAPLYFEYELSPLDRELVLLVPNFNGDFLGWIPWHYQGERKVRHAVSTVRDKDGNILKWFAEFFIPYSLLKPLQKVPPQKGTEWRVNMYRIDYDEQNTSWSWKPVEKNFHDFQKFGRVRFD